MWCLIGEICLSFPHRICVERTAIILFKFVAYEWNFNWLVQGMAGVSKWPIAGSIS
jgi:hypothetical protein